MQAKTWQAIWIKNSSFLLALLLGLFLCLYLYFDDQQRQAAFQSSMLPVKKIVVTNHRPLVLHFYADWCGPCRTFEPILKNALQPYGNDIDYRHLNVDQKENSKLLHLCGSIYLPTTVMFNREGNPVAREIGSVGAKELDRDLKRAFQ